MRRCPRLASPPALSLKPAPCWARFSTWLRNNWRDVSPTRARISTRLARRSTRCSPAKRAFEASSSPGVIAAILRGETPSLLAVRPDLPPALDRIVRTCLEKDPEARFASLHDVAMGLQWVRDEMRAGPPSGTDASGAPARRRFSITTAVVATMLVAIILGLSIVGWLLVKAPEGRLQLQHALQVTFATGAETQPAWSPDGGRIAYTAGA